MIIYINNKKLVNLAFFCQHVMHFKFTYKFASVLLNKNKLSTNLHGYNTNNNNLKIKKIK